MDGIEPESLARESNALTTQLRGGDTIMICHVYIHAIED